MLTSGDESDPPAAPVESNISPSDDAVPIDPQADLPLGHPDISGSTSPTAGALSGTVREVIDVERYTYLRVAGAKGEFWAAVSTTKIAVGDDITIHDAARMEDFESRSLGRTFAVIYFGSAGPKVQDTLPPGHPPAAGSATTTGHGQLTAADLSISRARGPDAYTVAEIHLKAKQLAGKSVRVAGRVLRVTPNVLGRTWLHIQDGSGSEADGTHDLVVTTVTTGESPESGQEVLVRGVVATDKDLGSGYRYDALIEDAEILPRAAK